jgi:hypothetical protein
MIESEFDKKWKRSLIEELRKIGAELQRMNDNYEAIHMPRKPQDVEEDFH